MFLYLNLIIYILIIIRANKIYLCCYKYTPKNFFILQYIYYLYLPHCA